MNDYKPHYEVWVSKRTWVYSNEEFAFKGGFDRGYKQCQTDISSPCWHMLSENNICKYCYSPLLSIPSS